MHMITQKGSYKIPTGIFDKFHIIYMIFLGCLVRFETPYYDKGTYYDELNKPLKILYVKMHLL
jgi:hypothetical protein